MKRFTTFLAPLTLALSLVSCGGSSGSSSSTDAVFTSIPDDPETENIDESIEAQKQFVFDVMSDYYLYYDQMPAINLDDYGTPEAVLAALVVNPPDRFSYIGDRVAQQNLFEEGTYEGIGYGRVVNDDDTQTVIYVFDESAAGRACPGSLSSDSCLQRGDTILSTSRSGNDITFNVDRNGSLFNTTLAIGIVQINTVLTTTIQTHNGVDVGYLALSAFLEPTVSELNTAFAALSGNVDELVLDLRYNGGGRVSTAQLLASYIAGINGDGSDVTRLEWNDRNTNENSSYPFRTLSNQLDLDRVYVLTLEGTCSASELVINAMTGIGVDAITIGQTTCGKPVGSVSFNFDDKVLQPITFSVVNEVGNGDYFDGIEASCFAEDDPARDFSDPTERMYAGALYHIANGTCEFISTRNIEQQARTPFNPDPMANLF
ncbi:MAG: S41 family peptidase [Cellvibrionaceae bacterium]